MKRPGVVGDTWGSLTYSMKGQFTRFVQAQDDVYKEVTSELKAGKKKEHWMWFIFPQIQGLGTSPNAQYYALDSVQQAREYLHHPILGPRLVECARLMLGHTDKTATQILGTPDDVKLKSSMTLFALCGHEETVFNEVLDAFYGGQRCRRTTSFGNLG